MKYCKINFILFLLVFTINCNKICVFGAGYVGLVVSIGFAELGHDIICVEKDQSKVNNLQKGEAHFYEPGLSDLLKKNLDAKKLVFTVDAKTSIEESDIIYLAVGTPSGEDGNADLTTIFDVAKSIADHINSYKVLVVKSTVPIGTCNVIKQFISSLTTVQFDIVSNPEFLREGFAIFDFFNPERIVIGSDSSVAMNKVKECHNYFIEKKVPIVETDLVTSETIKYASNAFLAVKISFINEMANLSEKTGANIKDISLGMGLDSRIGAKFLQPGPGFGGSCFPKDTKAILFKSDQLGVNLRVIKAALEANEYQKQHVVEKVCEKLGADLSGKKIAVLGLAFKENTDDVRESPAIDIIEGLKSKGAILNCYDLLAIENMKKIMPSANYFFKVSDAIQNIDLILVLTNCFDSDLLNNTKAPIIYTR